MRQLAALLAFVLAACTSGGGPSPSAPPSPAVATAIGPAGLLVYATNAEVLTYDPLTRRSVLAAKPGGEIADLAVSTDGRYAAVLTGERGFMFALTVVDLATRQSRTLEREIHDPRVRAIAGGFVVAEDNVLRRFEPAATLAGREPEEAALRGPGAEGHLLATDGSRVLVAFGADVSGQGGADTVYEVDPDGSTRRLFADGDGRPGSQPRNYPIRLAAFTADGARLVYTTSGGNGCDVTTELVVLDLRTMREVPTATPRVGDGVFVDTITTGPDGRTVVGYTSEIGECGAPTPTGGAYALRGTSWTLDVPNASWAAVGPRGHRASIEAGGALTVDGASVAPALFAAWAVV